MATFLSYCVTIGVSRASAPSTSALSTGLIKKPGCLAIALTREAQRILGEQFASHVAERRYRCLVANGPRQDEDTLRGKLGAVRMAVAQWSLIAYRAKRRLRISRSSVASSVVQNCGCDLRPVGLIRYACTWHRSAARCWAIRCMDRVAKRVQNYRVRRDSCCMQNRSASIILGPASA